MARKLTDKQATEILRLFNGGIAVGDPAHYDAKFGDYSNYLTPLTIGRRYGVSKTCICDLLEGRTYRDVKGPRRARQ